MKKLWFDFEKKIQQNKLLLSLNLPTESIKFDRLECLIGCKLPESFKLFYAVHDGQKKCHTGIFDGKFFLSIEEIESEWKIWSKLQDDLFFDDLTSNSDIEIKPKWWNKKWIPFTSDGSGNHLCIDLDPSSYGSFGQVIEIWHDDDKRKYICKDLNKFLEKMIEILSRD